MRCNLVDLRDDCAEEGSRTQEEEDAIHPLSIRHCVYVSVSHGSECCDHVVKADQVFVGDVLVVDVFGGVEGRHVVFRRGRDLLDAVEYAGEEVDAEDGDDDQTHDLEQGRPDVDHSVVFNRLHDFDAFEEANDFEHPDDLHDAQDPLVAGRIDGPDSPFARLVHGDVHVGPRHAGEAVEPKAADGSEVPGHDEADVVAVGLGGVERADDELAGDLDQEEGVDRDVEDEGGEHVARVAEVPQEDLRRHHHGGVEQRHPAQEHQPLNESRIRVDQPAPLLPVPPVGPADAEEVLQPVLLGPIRIRARGALRALRRAQRLALQRHLELLLEPLSVLLLLQLCSVLGQG
mmetsp:Transcript_41589/g.86910  ORF Transcript_41589/g.86910 Transcript_41589/m.86910 type:complete len:346 (+) Transcript_41589:1291-2328(+)